MNEDSSVGVWGAGTLRWEFLHIDDQAAACFHLLQISNANFEKRALFMRSQIDVG